VVSHISWRWLFLANVPLALFAAWRLYKLPAGERHPKTVQGTDVAGHLLFAVGALGTLFWLTSGGHRFAWMSGTSLGIAVIASMSLAALVWHERRHRAPFLPVELFRNLTIRLSSVQVMLWAACMFAVIFFLPIYLQLGHRMSAQASGLLLLPVTIGQVTAALVVTRILRKTGNPHPLPVCGMAVTSIGLLSLGVLPPHIAVIVILGFITGAGLGTVMPINQVVVQTVAGRAQLGAAMATISLSRSTGGAAGAALFGALVFAMIPDADRQTITQHANQFEVDIVIRAFHLAFLFAAAVAAFSAYVAYRIPRTKLWHADRGA
jgi:MFS family permease